ncbi:unnamed protein product, partial [marine sediment metagenome]
PENAEFYQKNRDEFKDKVDRTLFGDELVDMFSGETLSKLLENKTFIYLSGEGLPGRETYQ